MLRNHPERDEIELLVGVIVLDHTLGPLMHDVVVIDVAAGVDADQQPAALRQSLRGGPVEWKYIAAAADIEPFRAFRHQAEHGGFVPVIRADIAETLTQNGRPPPPGTRPVFQAEDFR